MAKESLDTTVAMQLGTWKGVRVAVTGGTSGLGLALVRILLDRGARVAFVARNRDGVERLTGERPGVHGIVGDVRWLAAPAPWTMLADPACLQRSDGGLTLFAERMDHRIGRGEIWSAELAPGSRLSGRGRAGRPTPRSAPRPAARHRPR